MEILNVKSKSLARATVVFRDKYMYFSRGAIEHYGLEIGKRISFVTEVDRLYFYVNDDPDGFLICKREGGALVWAVLIMEVLLDQLPTLLRSGKKFPLKKTNTEVNGSKLVEILFHNKP